MPDFFMRLSSLALEDALAEGDETLDLLASRFFADVFNVGARALSKAVDIPLGEFFPDGDYFSLFVGGKRPTLEITIFATISDKWGNKARQDELTEIVDNAVREYLDSLNAACSQWTFTVCIRLTQGSFRISKPKVKP
jgi:hypothetical protein